MSEHRFRHQVPSRRPAAVAASPAGAATVAFMPVPIAAAVPPAMAAIYRLAYEAALARIVARRRCFAPFSVN